MSSQSKSRTYGFVVLSILTHAALAAGILIYNHKSESTQKESAEVEMVAGGNSEPEASEAPVQAETANESEAPKVADTPKAEVAEAPVAKAPAPALPAKKAASTPTKPAPVAKAIPKALPAAKHSAPVAKATVSEETPKQEDSPVAVAVPVTQDSQETSEEAATEETKPTAKEEAPAEEAAAPEEKVTAAPAQAPEEKEEVQPEPEEKPAAVIKKKKEEPPQEQPAEEQASREDREREALSAAAADRMAQEAQAAREAEQAKKAEATRLAEQERIAEKAKADAVVAGEGNGGEGSGAGTGSGSSSGPGDSEVRALADLKQRPGNKRPQYDHADRLNGRQGEVSFLAYVSKEGALTEFKMLQSSGHRELDAKTLKAIKGWKFQPGQEGWVEIPFKWDLNGGPQEMPATLRRRAQVSQSSSN